MCFFNINYETDQIDFDGMKIPLHPDYVKNSQKDTKNKIPVIIDTKNIISFSQAHIEVLHILHNSIQKNFFGYKKPYSYRDEKKRIEWNEVLWGGYHLEKWHPSNYQKIIDDFT